MAEYSNTPRAGGIKPAIEWPKPVINNPRTALEDASHMLERLKALLENNNDDLVDLLPEASSERQAIANVWLIYRIVAEKMCELDALISAIVETSYAELPTSVGRVGPIDGFNDRAEG